MLNVVPFLVRGLLIFTLCHNVFDIAVEKIWPLARSGGILQSGVCYYFLLFLLATSNAAYTHFMMLPQSWLGGQKENLSLAAMTLIGIGICSKNFVLIFFGRCLQNAGTFINMIVC